MLPESVCVCRAPDEASNYAGLHSILTFIGQPFTHLMTKSMSLLAMVTPTSGTLYGVLKWVSIVALNAPETKVNKCVCFGKQDKGEEADRM